MTSVNVFWMSLWSRRGVAKRILLTGMPNSRLQNSNPQTKWWHHSGLKRESDWWVGLGIGNQYLYRPKQSNIKTSPVKQFLRLITFVSILEKKDYFYGFSSQPITATVFWFNVTCDWLPTSQTVCGEAERGGFDSRGSSVVAFYT